MMLNYCNQDRFRNFLTLWHKCCLDKTPNGLNIKDTDLSTLIWYHRYNHNDYFVVFTT